MTRPRKGRDRPTETEITRAMEVAGVDAYGCLDPDVDDRETIVRTIFSAMLAASPWRHSPSR
jgi:hypothetical protein